MIVGSQERLPRATSDRRDPALRYQPLIGSIHQNLLAQQKFGSHLGPYAIRKMKRDIKDEGKASEIKREQREHDKTYIEEATIGSPIFVSKYRR